MSDPDAQRATEFATLRRDILTELGPVLVSVFAGHAWGRILVTTTRRGDDLVVASIDVDDVIGPEADIENAMASSELRASLPGLAQAVEALTATCELDVDATGGGTFLRRGALEDGFGFLPGLLRAPSAGFERLRDVAVEKVGSRALHGEDALAKAVPIGTFADDAVTFTHAWANPSLAKDQAALSRRLLDRFPERSLWEISTPQFATDRDTAWALACVIATGLGKLPVRHEIVGGLVFGLAEAT